MTNTSKEAVELLPCPFCGGEASVYTARTENYGYWSSTRAAGCRERCASSPAFDTQNFVQGKGMVEVDADSLAIAAWNTRPTITPAHAAKVLLAEGIHMEYLQIDLERNMVDGSMSHGAALCAALRAITLDTTTPTCDNTREGE